MLGAYKVWRLGFALSKCGVGATNIMAAKGDITKSLSKMLRHIPLFKEAQIRVIGSAEAGLCGPKSDMDFLIRMKENGIISAMEVVVWELQGQETDFRLEYYIKKAKVPVIRVRHRGSAIACDLTFDCPAMRRDDAIKNTHLLKLYGKNNTFRKIYMFIKFILGDHKIFSRKLGGLSSYAHAILLIYFLVNKTGCAFIDPHTFQITQQKERGMSLPEKLIRYFVFIRDELQVTEIDITKLHKNRIRTEVFQIKDPYIKKNHAKGLSSRNLQTFRALAGEWIYYFQTPNSKLLLAYIKMQIPIINNASMDQENDRETGVGFIEIG